MYDIVYPSANRGAGRVIEESASPDLTIAQLKCEQAWREAFPASSKDALISWEDGRMQYTYKNREAPAAFANTLTRRCEYQLREVQLSDEPEPGLYEVFATRNTQRPEDVEILVAAVPANRAHWECERKWRELLPHMRDAALSWKSGAMYYLLPEEQTPQKCFVQVRRMSTPEPQNLKSIEYSTIVGTRTYHLDVFGDRMHAAVYSMIVEHNRTVEFWLELTDKNRTALPDKDISITRDYALMNGGKMEGMHHCIDAALRALGML